ncbi:MAG: transporter [Deltaproteobacteria bacterium]|nr:transporter [Deltaproteobacteria bacterium]
MDRQHIIRPLCFFILAGFAVILSVLSAATGSDHQQLSQAESGRDLYEKACAACHGSDGAGASPSRVGFDTPLPDFTDCRFAPREADTDWIAVTEKGGPARAFERMMPAFGAALTIEQSQKILDHIRTFCPDKTWPRGELNLPTPLFTTKAYPEDEAVLYAFADTEGRDRIAWELVYEKRLGARNQLEFILPFGWSEQRMSRDGDTGWTSGLGDIGIGFKRVMFHSLESGSIVSLGGEVFFPTGDKDKDFGNDTTVVEPYLAYGQILPKDFFLHTQAGFAYPFDRDKLNEEVFLKVAVGRTFLTGRFGRSWSPMIEVLSSKELTSGSEINWDLAPQLQVTLSRRQHVRLNLGFRVPMNNTDVRKVQFGAYLLWDWFDGGFFEGW